MTVEIRKAERTKAKLRLGLAGPSGAGKTMSSLKLAKGITPAGRILMIDTERGSGDLYADLFDYDIITLQPPYKPEKYVEAIRAGEEAGYDTIILDSLSHAWSDEGGILDQADKLSAGGNRFTVWAKLTPQHRSLVNAMLNSPAHIIATVRSKQDYNAHASKDRTNLFKDEVFTPSEKVGERILEWLNSGKDAAPEDINRKKAKILHCLKLLGADVTTQESASGGKGGNISRPSADRAAKIHALTDAECRPVAFLLTRGQIADTAGAVLLEQMPRSAILHADKGYDSDAIRRQVQGKVRCRTSRPRQTDTGRIAFRPSSIEAATPSSVCSVA